MPAFNPATAGQTIPPGATLPQQSFLRAFQLEKHELDNTNPKTKTVEVRLAALTRVEYTERVEVPADITAAELEQLVQERYDAVDGGLYTDDPDYWEQGNCYATDAEGGDEKADVIVRRSRGALVIEKLAEKED